MPSWTELLRILGPLAVILPRVALRLLSALAALVAAALCGRAVRQRRPVVFAAAWLACGGSVGGGVLGSDSLAALGAPALASEPLSGAGLLALTAAHWVSLVVALGIGLIGSVLLSRGRDVGASEVLRATRDERVRAVGDAGEVLVAGTVAGLGWPALRNVVLGPRGRTVEIDHLIRAPGGIVVLETKTLGGIIEGEMEGETWTQRARGAVRAFHSPLRQNLAHVRAVEAFLADDRVRVWGHVVSAGAARFAPAIADAVVPIDLLPTVLGGAGMAAGPSARAIDHGWRRLAREARRGERRRGAHAATVQYRHRHPSWV